MEVKQIVIRHMDRDFEVVYQDKVIITIPFDETGFSAVDRVLRALGFEITEKK